MNNLKTDNRCDLKLGLCIFFTIIFPFKRKKNFLKKVEYNFSKQYMYSKNNWYDEDRKHCFWMYIYVIYMCECVSIHVLRKCTNTNMQKQLC